MAVAVRILLQIVLVVLLGGIVVLERADLHEELFAASPLDLRDALHRLLRAFVGVVNAGLILAAPVVALPVLHRGVDHIEVGQQQGVETHLPGVILHPHGLPEAGVRLCRRSDNRRPPRRCRWHSRSAASMTPGMDCISCSMPQKQPPARYMTFSVVSIYMLPSPDISEDCPVISFSSVFCGIFFCPAAQPLSSSTAVSRSGNALRYMV